MNLQRRHSLGRILGYHGCDASLGEAVLAGSKELKPSDNVYDWLGQGIYFWVDSPERALAWAIEQSEKSPQKIRDPFVVGAFISPALCLNLTDYGAGAEVIYAYHLYKDISGNTNLPLATNKKFRNGMSLVRDLDCAVILALHRFREENGNAPYDSVYGVFEEGPELFEGSGMRRKTHIQIAVRNPTCILGYFRVRQNR